MAMPDSLRLKDKYNNLETVALIVERAALIVSGKPHVNEITNNRWSIDEAGNNWWLTWNERAGTIEIYMRYDQKPGLTYESHCSRLRVVDAVMFLIAFFFDLEIEVPPTVAN